MNSHRHLKRTNVRRGPALTRQAGFLLDFEPVVWIGAEPEGIEEMRPGREPEISFADDVLGDVWSESLGESVRFFATRAGLIFVESETEDLRLDAHVERDFDAAVQVRSEQIRILNSFAYCLHCSIVAARPDLGAVAVTHSNLVYRGADKQGLGGSPQVQARMLQLAFQPTMALAIGDVLPTSFLDSAAQQLSSIYYNSNSKALQLCALLNRSLTAYKDHDFPTSLVTAWSVIEAAQSSIWSEYVHESCDRNALTLNKDRRKKLHGRDFSASVVTEILSLAGRYSEESRRAVDEPRQARNSWLHSTEEPERTTVARAVITAHDLFSRAFSIEMTRPSLEISVRS